MNQKRTLRVGDRVRETLAQAIREEVRDPRIGFVTITEVELSSDLRYARVFVSMLGEEMEERLTILRRATPFLRKTLAAQAGLRFTPELRFELDPTAGTADRMERIFEELGPGDEEPT
ncbi:MAG: 30S ribosome-binding factor RbfA [Acidobacteriota bacterium]|nr:30S ribosome-binding factor RbfA [Acidobacteriota bacterium]MDH3784895.1 30S ribosome-binding factor RbfA [Acidobacteriota bacterium]